jgi:hypothetical protein
VLSSPPSTFSADRRLPRSATQVRGLPADPANALACRSPGVQRHRRHEDVTRHGHLRARRLIFLPRRGQLQLRCADLERSGDRRRTSVTACERRRTNRRACGGVLAGHGLFAPELRFRTTVERPGRRKATSDRAAVSRDNQRLYRRSRPAQGADLKCVLSRPGSAGSRTPSTGGCRSLLNTKRVPRTQPCEKRSRPDYPFARSASVILRDLVPGAGQASPS